MWIEHMEKLHHFDKGLMHLRLMILSGELWNQFPLDPVGGERYMILYMNSHDYICIFNRTRGKVFLKKVEGIDNKLNKLQDCFHRCNGILVTKNKCII